MLTCRDVTGLVTDYVEGRLSLRERLRFQMHVGMCRHCRRYLRQMRRTSRLLGDLPPEPMADDVYRELQQRFLHWKRTGTPS